MYLPLERSGGDADSEASGGPAEMALPQRRRRRLATLASQLAAGYSHLPDWTDHELYPVRADPRQTRCAVHLATQRQCATPVREL